MRLALRKSRCIRPVPASFIANQFHDSGRAGGTRDRNTLEHTAPEKSSPPADGAHPFSPPASWRSKIAPTEYDEQGKMLRGVVHDPRARRMGGVAGHAGVFSTADDLSRFARALLKGSPILAGDMVEKMTTPQQPPTAQVLRGFGWDIDSPFSSNRGELLARGIVRPHRLHRHIAVDRSDDPDLHHSADQRRPSSREGKRIALRSKVATAVAAALPLTVSEKDELRWKSITGYNEAQTAARRIATRNGSVQTGIDVLEAQNFDRSPRLHRQKANRTAHQPDRNGPAGTPHYRRPGPGPGHFTGRDFQSRARRHRRPGHDRRGQHGTRPQVSPSTACTE